MKIFMSIPTVKWILIISFVAGFSLIFFVIQSIRTDIILYVVGMYISLVISGIFLIVLYSLYKTRIEVNEKEIYAPCYPWYQDFKIFSDDVPMLKKIRYFDISSIHIIDIHYEESGKSDKGIHVKSIKKFDFVIPLDGYSLEKQQAIFEYINKRVIKIDAETITII